MKTFAPSRVTEHTPGMAYVFNEPMCADHGLHSGSDDSSLDVINDLTGPECEPAVQIGSAHGEDGLWYNVMRVGNTFYAHAAGCPPTEGECLFIVKRVDVPGLGAHPIRFVVAQMASMLGVTVEVMLGLDVAARDANNPLAPLVFNKGS